jgi:hypothetical protein
MFALPLALLALLLSSCSIALSNVQVSGEAEEVIDNATTAEAKPFYE